MDCSIRRYLVFKCFIYINKGVKTSFVKFLKLRLSKILKMINKILCIFAIVAIVFINRIQVYADILEREEAYNTQNHPKDF